jgi:aspartate 1-decarboxylase
MFRTLLKSKIHRVAVTDCELHYEGSCAIDEDLLDAANLAENEQVHIWNINNGERFVTYAIRGECGTGIISVNGSAARRASVGDLIIIAAFGLVPEDQVGSYKPKLVFVDGANRIKEERAHSGAGGLRRDRNGLTRGALRRTRAANGWLVRHAALVLYSSGDICSPPHSFPPLTLLAKAS